MEPSILITTMKASLKKIKVKLSFYNRFKKIHWLIKLWLLVFLGGIMLSLVVVPIVIKYRSYEVIEKKITYVPFNDKLHDSFAISNLDDLDNMMNYYCKHYHQNFTWYKCDTSKLFDIARIIKIPSNTPVEVIEYLQDSTLARIVFIDERFKSKPDKKVFIPSLFLY